MSIKENGLYISLSKEENSIIEGDMKLFRNYSVNKDKNYEFTVNKFLNRIFLNLCEGEEVTLQKPQKRKNHTSVSYIIKVNNEIIRKMTMAGIDSDYYPADSSAYYTYFISEYCKNTLTDREKIFYRPLIQEIKDAIELKNLLLIDTNKGRHSTLLPYVLKTSEENGKHYIAGFLLNEENGQYFYNKLLCVPLQSILFCSEKNHIRRGRKIFPEKDIAFQEKSLVHSYDEMKKYIEERLRSDGILYLSDTLRDVKVRLSTKGMEYLYSRTQYKPVNIHFDSNDNSNKQIIHFQATYLQTFMYFFKFGEEAEILSPFQYRKKFLQKYERAFKLYSNKEKTTPSEEHELNKN